MQIDEAIKLQRELKGLLPEVGFNKWMASTQLGIEALEWIEFHRRISPDHVVKKLPGETIDRGEEK